MAQHQSPEKAATAYHEAGHATATVLGFRMAKLPRPRQSVLVRKVEITQQDDGGWSGHCHAMNVYSVGWPRHRIASRYRDLMKAQITVHLAGGLAEAAHRGVRSKDAMLADALDHCDMDEDMTRAMAVLDDLNSLAGRKYDEEHFAGRTRALLAIFWPAVTAVAMALLDQGRVEGERVEQIVVSAMARQPSWARRMCGWRRPMRGI